MLYARDESEVAAAYARKPRCPACHKLVFRDRAEAAAFGATLPNPKCKAYPCVHCGGWHAATVKPNECRNGKRRRGL